MSYKKEMISRLKYHRDMTLNPNHNVLTRMMHFKELTISALNAVSVDKSIVPSWAQSEKIWTHTVGRLSDEFMTSDKRGSVLQAFTKCYEQVLQRKSAMRHPSDSEGVFGFSLDDITGGDVKATHARADRMINVLGQKAVRLSQG